MTKFFQWVFHYKTPMWVVMVVLIVGLILFVLFLAFTFALLDSGYWPVVLFLWVFMPIYFVYAEYLRSGGE